MREFFKPWRRKLGVLVLVLACVLMAGWARSQRMIDELSVDVFGHQHSFRFANRCFSELGIDRAPR